MSDQDKEDDSVQAISSIIAALRPLDIFTRAHVLEFVIKRLDIKLMQSELPIRDVEAKTDTRGTATESIDIPTKQNSQTSTIKDIRSFAKIKSPKTINEKVALVAHFIASLAEESERRDFITSDDIEPYFTQAGFELPTASKSMTLQHAKNAGYLTAKERGKYKLNAVGHNLVVHKLPHSAK